MGKYDKLRKQSDEAIEKVKKDAANFSVIADESRRVADVAHHAGEIISDLDRQFAKATGLDGKDIAFLFLATGLQIARWVLLPSFDLDFEKTPSQERLTAGEGGKIENDKQKEYLLSHKNEKTIGSDKYFTWEEIVRAPVPYDAMEGTQDIVIPGVTPLGKRIGSKNHHAATWGHDPIIGWIIGPLNIISRTITFTNGLTRYVALNEPMIFKSSGLASRGQTVLPIPCSPPKMVSECIESISEDNKRLFAAVAKQGMHQASDKFTKYGLQIPLISPAKAQMLLKEGWNSAEAEKAINKLGKNLSIVGMQASLNVLINQIIRALHLLLYDENKGLSFAEYEVKTRKILSYSNMISSASNIIWVGGNMIAGNEGAVKDLDVGGLLVTIHRLLTDYKFIQSIKQEFLQNQWYEIVMGEELKLIVSSDL